MIVQIFSAFAIVALVLVQRGKGAEAGAGFGAGASGTVFGARGAGTALSRATAIFTAVFMLNSLALAYVGQRATAPKTIFDTAGQVAPGPTNPAGARLPGAPGPGSGAVGAPRSSPGSPAPGTSTQAAPAAGAIPAPAPAAPGK